MANYIRSMYSPQEKIESPEVLEILERLQGIVNSYYVNDYDRNAISDLKSFRLSKGYVTRNQFEFVKKLNERYDDEALVTADSFRSSFTEEMRRKLDIVCEYYSHTGYFNSIVSKWKQDKQGFIPTPEQYEKITENSYAKKLVEAHTSPFEFELGQLVSLRSTARNSNIYAKAYVSTSNYLNKPLFIVNNNVLREGQIYRYCRVFAISNPDVHFDVREKDLKKYKSK